MKKKMLTFVMALLIVPCMVLLAACGNSGTVEGKYVIEQITTAVPGATTEMTLTKESVEEAIANPNTPQEMLMVYTMFQSLFNTNFEIKADKTWTTTMPGEATPINGKWVMEGDKISFTADGETEALTGSFKDGKITISDDGTNTEGMAMTIVLKKA